MPFIVIQGQYLPKVGTPDGDSVRFKARNPKLWGKLEGKPVRLGTSAASAGTVQLRFEAIDAMEKGAQQPLSGEATANMKRLLGYDAEAQPTPTGYVLARMTDDKSGRPIAFAFAGRCPWRDGSEVRLSAAQVRGSVNYKQALAGHAYPMYYHTLFADLRREFDAAVAAARRARRGVWRSDKSTSGVRFNGAESLLTIDPVWPKLWRRLQEFARTGEPMSKFIAFLEAKNERMDVLDVMEERGLQDLVKVNGNRVRLTERPENLRVRAQAGKRK
jgi:endonuclease YncB( thermonuclease family)